MRFLMNVRILYDVQSHDRVTKLTTKWKKELHRSLLMAVQLPSGVWLHHYVTKLSFEAITTGEKCVRFLMNVRLPCGTWSAYGVGSFRSKRAKGCTGVSCLFWMFVSSMVLDHLSESQAMISSEQKRSIGVSCSFWMFASDAMLDQLAELPDFAWKLPTEVYRSIRSLISVGLSCDARSEDQDARLTSNWETEMNMWTGVSGAL